VRGSDAIGVWELPVGGIVLKMKSVDHAAVSGLGRLATAGVNTTFDCRSSGFQNGFYMRYGKRALDVMLVLLSAPIVVPVVAMCAIALWLESGQPLFRQNRLGRGGQVFVMWKLRTMVHNADEMLEQHLETDPVLREEWTQNQKLKRDPRITPLGRLLRATSLDELPQLWNVLVGQMSLVGARPMMVNQLDLYGNADGYFMLRPGVTGPWQVGDRNQISFCGRADIDDAYSRDITLGRDVQILLETITVVVRGTGY